MDSSLDLRAALVAKLTAADVIRSAAVTDAFLSVPREDFVPEIAARRGLAAVYADVSLIVQERDGAPTSSSSQPWIMAEMLEALDVRDGHRVLEIGLGTGYNAGLLSRLVGAAGRVTSVDIDPGLVADATAALKAGGYPVATAVADGRAPIDGGPFDRIIVTASTDHVPDHWCAQLVPGGLLIVPLRVSALQIIAVLQRTPAGLRSVALIPGGFMPLRDDVAAPVDAVASLTIRQALPGTPLIDMQAYGAGIVTCTVAARRALPGRLLQGPTATAEVGPLPAWPAVWNLLLGTDYAEQIAVYGGPGAGTRFGLIEPETGACTLLHAHRDGGRPDWVVTTVESYGPAEHSQAEVLRRVNEFAASGITSLDQLGIEVTDAGRLVIGWHGLPDPDRR
ncbi:protein-L-isoaspartate O-methyltransferase family protein [Krasilnikovia sp. MM14-A1259]|uniref:protein-L-isoaspartate O-methyltransferase family protein n=1 Tax=Krasilnikovia sp. MM14-A1259 TaxID=3373539 RepID=UPI00380846F3